MAWGILLKDSKNTFDILNLKVLGAGQSFRWKFFSSQFGNVKAEVNTHVNGSGNTNANGKDLRIHDSNFWRGVIKDHIIDLKQTETTIEFRHWNEKAQSWEAKSQIEELLKDYFQLNVDLKGLYGKWAEVDPNFKKIGANLQGIRILRQDPVETLFAFICSSCNNIPRITSMVNKLCTIYGEKIGKIEDETYYSFPCVAALAAEQVEERLRAENFGYRAKYIMQTAQYILASMNSSSASSTSASISISNQTPKSKSSKSNNTSSSNSAALTSPELLLHSLRNQSYVEAKTFLLKLSGIGPKVADCICLMSLDKTHVVPVDTHVWQYAVRDYGFTAAIATKSLTKKVYDDVAMMFHNLHGDYAGWAQSVLFTADLQPKEPSKKANKRKKDPSENKREDEEEKEEEEEKKEEIEKTPLNPTSPASQKKGGGRKKQEKIEKNESPTQPKKKRKN